MLFAYALLECYTYPTAVFNGKMIRVEFYDNCQQRVHRKTKLEVKLEVDGIEGLFTKITQVKGHHEVMVMLGCQHLVPLNEKCEGFIDAITDDMEGVLTINAQDGSAEENLPVTIIFEPHHK
ncbi:Hypothetical_protein [Hexamita inflata]|uniref:Hypothetical_protein n=1 Tax=Hexamita inflata TaxID=28002 RepID=A0AA86P3T1_9EUKA|nr:Hypothetical protein HINF_LOCUS19039 [Hexamita inflata]